MNEHALFLVRYTSSRTGGFYSVFKQAHTVNKYAPNKLPFGCGCPTNIVIPSEAWESRRQPYTPSKRYSEIVAGVLTLA